ncbi:unnamed protein product [Prorocentrum cordatum]|uniref:Uncharacterized protein n=1 Tax=Prorocentrum cordatum TaxID=2364126 RepID=A0ABN9XG24_9DINO|nr:unnamed protein product [Polarella glacialis]
MSIYIQDLNITGAWLRGKQSFFSVTEFGGKVGMGKTAWAKYEKASVQIAQGRTANGARYLNVFTKGLANTGYLVGGLLGIVDHAAAPLPGPQRKKTLTL